MHKEAEECRVKNQAYLLAYKGQYFVATAEYIRHLGIDPDAEVWENIGWELSSSSSFDKIYDYLRKENLLKS